MPRMSRNIDTVRPARQAGAAGSVVVLLALAFLVWWQWDWIAGLLGSGGGRAVAEVVDYRCDSSGGRAVVDGRVRNASDAPVRLRAVTAIYDSSGKKSDYFEAAVQPSLLKPGDAGSFRAEGPALPDGGACRLDGFVDSEAGKRVRHSGGR